MKRFALITVLFLPLAGLAVASDETGSSVFDTIEIRVAAHDLQTCRDTLAALEKRDIVADDGTWVPRIFLNNDLPKSICVVDA